jgi:amidase
MNDEVIRASAAELSRLVREKRASSREVVEAHLRRIEQVNFRINAVVQLDSKGALRSAIAADEALSRGFTIGPLHGVPFTVKDWIETEGLICAAGIEERRAFVPRRDATVVARMRAAGAILLGKTNVPVLAGARVYPRANNPHDVEQTPGASSGGEAAIIAAGGSPLGLGSDSGGSIRLPATYCGVVGLRPTVGLVPITGHFPHIGALGDPRTTIGPMVRHVSDLYLALRTIAGPDGIDPATVPVLTANPEAVELSSLRIAWFVSIESANPTNETVSAVEAAARALQERGAHVEEARPPDIDKAAVVTRAYWARVRSMSWEQWQPGGKSSLGADETEESIFEWERFQRTMLAFMNRFDAIVTLAAPCPAGSHRQLGLEDYIYNLPWSLTAQPAVVVPCARSLEGMPIGVQIVSRRWRDDVAIAVAKALEDAFGGWQMAEVL